MTEKNHVMPMLTNERRVELIKYAEGMKDFSKHDKTGSNEVIWLANEILLAALTAKRAGSLIQAVNPHSGNVTLFYRAGGITSIDPEEVSEWEMTEEGEFYTAPPVPELTEAPLPKNLDRALTVMGVALPESVEEFNFHSDRWVQRLINRVIGLGPELDAERQKWQEERDALRAQLNGLAMQQPVRYLNKFSGVCLTLQQQPNAHEDKAVYQPLFGQAGPPDVPEGWKLVPVEPTEEMVIRGFESAPSIIFSDSEDWEAFEAMSGCQQAAHKAKLCWQAMLASAPEPGSKG